MGVLLTGVFTHNFTAICRDLTMAKAIEIVSDVDQLIEKISMLSRHLSEKNDMIIRAHRILEANQGAVIRYVTAIETILQSHIT